MAQDRLIRFATLAAVIAVGVTAEAFAPRSSWLLATADLAVGIALGAGGAWLLGRARASALLALAACALWFAGTLDGSTVEALDAIGVVCLLAYRGPLLGLMLITLGGRWARALTVVAWIASVLPLTVARPGTAAVAGITAELTIARARRAAADRRRVLLATGASCAVLTGIWLAAPALDGGTLLTLANDAAVVAAAAVALTAASGRWTRAAASALVVSLGSARHPGRPVTAQLARALADPDLELCYAVPGLGWVDEHGRAVDAPGGNGRTVTRAAADGGGEVALVHAGTADARLAAAATAAAALALDSARLEAQLRAGAADVRASRLRLLTTADAERRALEDRLNDRVLARLRRLDRQLENDELRAAIAELAALGRGLYPPTLARADVAQALTELAARARVPASVDVRVSAELPDGHRAALWFICAEALANVDKHAGASRAAIRLRATPSSVALEIFDDGRGGATPERGLRGIADRVEALEGTFSLSSPPGGPTLLRAELPV